MMEQLSGSDTKATCLRELWWPVSVQDFSILKKIFIGPKDTSVFPYEYQRNLESLYVKLVFTLSMLKQNEVYGHEYFFKHQFNKETQFAKA